MSKQKSGNPMKPPSQAPSKPSTGKPLKTVRGSVPKMVNPPPTPTKKK